MRRKQFEKVFNNRKESEEEVDLDQDFNDEVGKLENQKYKKFSAKKTDALKQAFDKYKGKKVNYEEIMKDDSEEIDEDGFEDDEEEGEEIEEGFEDIEDEDEEGEDLEDGEGEDIENEDEELENQEEEPTPSPKQKRKKSEDMNRDFDKEDEEYLKKISQHTPNEIKKGKNVQNQKNLFDFFINIRISLQKIITSINSLPQGETLKKFIDDSNIHLLKHTISDLLKLLSVFVTFQKEMILKNNFFDITNSKIAIEDFNNILKQIATYNKEILESHPLTSNKIEDVIKSLFTITDKLSSVYEKIINIWYRKTLVYSYKSNTGNKILKILNNNFCEHLKKNIDSNYDTIRQKSKKKPNEKILGKKHADYDEEIYNDYEFYSFILKEFISTKEDMTNTADASGNRMDLTLQYLLNRNQNKKNKNVDTRASKNRKLRFEKHEKILNFMVPIPNHILNSGRTEIINSIFGKGVKLRKNSEEHEDSDFEII